MGEARVGMDYATAFNKQLVFTQEGSCIERVVYTSGAMYSWYVTLTSIELLL